MENRNILIGLGTGLVAGFMLGYGVGTYFATSHQDHPAAQAPATPVAPPAGMMMPDQADMLNRIQAAQAVLAKDPKNFQALVSLGNDYFDTHQHQLAVDTYAKALAVAPDDPKVPDILTDQGVMYRELKQYDKALANFQRANKLKPDHLQSLLNLGVVYAADKNDKAAARKAWTKLISIAPDSSQAQQARTFLQGL